MAYLCPHPCDGKTEYGYCLYTWCINPLHGNLGTAYQGQGVQKAIITNADRIRAMSDEELAEYMSIYCCSHKTHDPRCQQFKDCGLCWLDWLKKEAET